MVGIGLHILIAILLLIEHLFGTPSEIAILKRQSIVEEYPNQHAMKQAADNKNEDALQDEVVELNKTTTSKSTRSSTSKGPYYSVPPEPQSTDEELEISTEAKRTSTFKPNVKLDYEPSINESEITVTIQPTKTRSDDVDDFQPASSNHQGSGEGSSPKKKKTKKNKDKMHENTAKAHQQENHNQFDSHSEPKNDPAAKKSKKSRHERPRSKYYETEEVDPNDNTWI